MNDRKEHSKNGKFESTRYTQLESRVRRLESNVYGRHATGYRAEFGEGVIPDDDACRGKITNPGCSGLSDTVRIEDEIDDEPTWNTNDHECITESPCDDSLGVKQSDDESNGRIQPSGGIQLPSRANSNEFEHSERTKCASTLDYTTFDSTLSPNVSEFLAYWDEKRRKEEKPVPVPEKKRSRSKSRISRIVSAPGTFMDMTTPFRVHHDHSYAKDSRTQKNAQPKKSLGAHGMGIGAIPSKDSTFDEHRKYFSALNKNEIRNLISEGSVVVYKNKVGESEKDAFERVRSEHPGRWLVQETTSGEKGNPNVVENPGVLGGKRGDISRDDKIGRVIAGEPFFVDGSNPNMFQERIPDHHSVHSLSGEFMGKEFNSRDNPDFIRVITSDTGDEWALLRNGPETIKAFEDTVMDGKDMEDSDNRFEKNSQGLHHPEESVDFIKFLDNNGPNHIAISKLNASIANGKPKMLYLCTLDKRRKAPYYCTHKIKLVKSFNEWSVIDFVGHSCHRECERRRKRKRIC
jgi:hypothetical protein